MTHRAPLQDKLGIFLVSSPTIDVAKKIATSLIENRLAACVQMIPTIRSMYMWDNMLQDETESLLLIKSESSKYQEISQLVKTIHPYEIPEIVEIPIQYADELYKKWILSELKSKPL